MADRLCTTEPETEGSEHNWRRHPRLSLLPSWAVRFRSRFALAGFGQKRAVPRVRILACQAGESDSLAIRLSEEQSSLEEYSKFEYHSLRHRVCCCGDFPPASRSCPRNFRDSAGFWRSRTGASEPETAGSECQRRRIPHSSLRPSWAVRFRSRFAYARASLVIRLCGS